MPILETLVQLLQAFNTLLDVVDKLATAGFGVTTVGGGVAYLRRRSQKRETHEPTSQAPRGLRS